MNKRRSDTDTVANEAARRGWRVEFGDSEVMLYRDDQVTGYTTGQHGHWFVRDMLCELDIKDIERDIAALMAAGASEAEAVAEMRAQGRGVTGGLRLYTRAEIEAGA